MPSRQMRQLPVAGPPPDLPQLDPTAVATAADPPDHRRSPLRPVLLATSLCVLLLVVAAAALALYRASRRRRRMALSSSVASADLVPAKQQEPPPPSPLPSPPAEPTRFSYEQLRSATASFSPTYKLGQGGFGPVFRGSLSDGREVAVKVMDDGSLQGEREFRNELSLAAALMVAPGDASRHVVFPIGYCSDDDGGGGGLDPHWKKKRKKTKKMKQRGLEEEDKWGIRKGRRSHRRRSGGATFTDEEGDGDLSCGGEEVEQGRRTRRLLLVYDLMHIGSLQDALLDRRCPELSAWGRRFAVALDVARGLEFLHFACEPPVVHGDIKPSNILLDAQFSAKIADLGLARVLTPAAAIPALEDDAAATIADDLSTTAAETESTATTALDEANTCLNTPAARTRMVNGGGYGVAVSACAPKESPVEDEGQEERCTRPTEADGGASPITATTALTTLEAISSSEVGGGYDKLSVDSGVELLTPGGQRGRRKKSGSEASGRDWWWRQDSAAGDGVKAELDGKTTVKEYVMEWIGSEVKKERPKGTWAESSTSTAGDSQVVPGRKSDHKKQQKRLEWWVSLDEHRIRRKGKNRPREWWREEFCEELAKKNRKKKKRSMARSSSGGGTKRQWWERDDDDDDDHQGVSSSLSSGRKSRRKAWSRGSSGRWADGLSGELRITRRRSSHDWANGDVPKSGGVSSTPSMRGTVCYAAPEYGGGGPLSEKCDIYSFGVLLLVLISGRRPLQVTASPMSEFERANLTSWARHLAHTGKLLDLVDASLHSVDREQALLCIMVALLCLQRSPSRRPTIREVINMLSGESEPLHLPLEFSPSPPCGLSFKSRRKAR